MIKRLATGRNTDIAKLLEDFLDNENEHLSQYLWENLEQVAEWIDNQVEEMEELIQELRSEILGLNDDNIDLISQLEELDK